MPQSFSLNDIPSDTSSWTALEPATFQACGLAIARVVSGPPTQRKLKKCTIPAVRAWLDEATRRQDGSTAHPWGVLCLALMDVYNEEPTSEHFLADRDRVAGYLKGMSRVAKRDFFRLGVSVSVIDMFGITRYRSRPAVEAFTAAMGCLVGSGQRICTPMLAALVQSDTWNPIALLEHMHALLPGQLEYLREKNGNDSLVATPHRCVLNLLAVATLYTPWRPEDKHLCGSIWYAVCDIRPTKKQATTLMTRLLESMPSQAARGLDLIVYKENMTPEQAALFFPLSLAQCEPQVLLAGIADIFAMTRADASSAMPLSLARSKRFEAELTKHHPALASLMALYFSLFPDTSRDEPNTTTLVEAFQFSMNTTQSLELPTLFAEAP